MKALIVVIMGGVGNIAGALVAGLMLGLRRNRGRAPRRSGPHHRGRPTRCSLPCCCGGRPACSGGRRDEPQRSPALGRRAPVVRRRRRAARVVRRSPGRLSSRARHLACCTSPCWPPPGRCSPARRTTSRSRPSRSSASAPTRWRCSARRCRGRWCSGSRRAIGVLVALIVGLSTLRLSGIYFVIFTFGLSELIRQLVTWYEVNINRSVGRYIFVDDHHRADLLAACWRSPCCVLLAGWLITRSRLGLALRVIGEDETVGAPRRHRHHRAPSSRCSPISAAVHDGDRRRSWRRAGPISIRRSRSIRCSRSKCVIMALLGGARRAVRPAARRGAAGAAVRVADRALPELFQRSCSASCSC